MAVGTDQQLRALGQAHPASISACDVYYYTHTATYSEKMEGKKSPLIYASAVTLSCPHL